MRWYRAAQVGGAPPRWRTMAGFRQPPARNAAVNTLMGYFENALQIEHRELHVIVERVEERRAVGREDGRGGRLERHKYIQSRFASAVKFSSLHARAEPRSGLNSLDARKVREPAFATGAQSWASPCLQRGLLVD
jgi:hypothetical protein